MQGFGNAKMKDIQIFQEEFHIHLPSDYIDFLLESNGGDVVLNDANSLHVEDAREGINVDVLFGIKLLDPELSIEFWTNKYKDEMPNGMIIIGDSYQHGFFVLACSGKDLGVYYWDDTHELNCSSDESNVYFLAETFTDFIKSLL